MLRRPGQAAAHCLHLLCDIVLGGALLLVAAGSLLAWKLAEGPINLAFLIPRAEAAFNGGPDSPHLTIGAAALGWQGFRNGVESPLDLVFADIVLRGENGAGMAEIPVAEVSLSVPQLLIGRIVPRRIIIENPKVRVLRNAQGRLAVSFGRRRESVAPSSATTSLLREIVAALNSPPGISPGISPGTPRGPLHSGASAPARRFPALSQLRILAIHGAELSVVDQKLGATWYAPTASLTLFRGAEGGLTGNGEITVAVNGRQAALSLQASLHKQSGLAVAASLSPIRPAELATILPSLAPLAAVNAPVTLDADFTMASEAAQPELRLRGALGAGEVSFGGGTVPIDGGALALTASPEAAALDTLMLHLAGPNGTPGPALTANGSARRTKAGGWNGTLSVGTSGVKMADLARYWPPEISKDGRAWVTGNITAGTADKADLALGFTAAADGGDFDITHIDGHVAGSGLTVHWLRPVPPLTDGAATLSITSPDSLTIAVAHAKEGALTVTSGNVRFTGLSAREQDGAIAAQIAGPLPAVLTLLEEKRLHLLARRKLPFTDVAGSTETALTVSLPLDDRVTMDQVRMRADATLSAVHLGGVVAGHALDNGTLRLTADNDGLTIAGSGAVAAIPAQFSYALDFRAGPANGIAQQGKLEARANAKALAGLGIGGLDDVLTGPIDLTADFSEARNGAGTAAVKAGLTDAALTLAPIGLAKPAGSNAAAHATITLTTNRIDAIPSFGLTGAGLSLSGTASFAGGRPILVRIAHATIGRTEAAGSVRFPSDGQPMTIVLSGPTLDLSARFAHQAHKGAARRPTVTAKPARGLPWTLDATFGRALLAGDQPLSHCRLHAESNGLRITTARLTGDLASGRPLTIAITPEGGFRQLTITTDDAGALLAATDISQGVRDGSLSISARYDDTLTGSPLSGNAEIDDFRVLRVPALARVLQAMTLYGLAETIEGPGLRFSKLIAPFDLAGDQLAFGEARAFNPSLGLTMTGSIDLATRSANLSGTIVPAYFFNSLLGHIPLIGRLFSPEKGGGVFAAAYTVHGPLDDPAVHVNPLSAVTPGFLRGLFSVFNEEKR
ncbi:MAG TPA: DUF3971 domain-containing protein [Acetobacteraceae bacterium]|nr:DUF3971 domain-containing protein [Acetobacteraceae bacterium]